MFTLINPFCFVEAMETQITNDNSARPHTTQDCLNKLVAKFPNLEDIHGCMVLALNEEYTTESTIVKDKDEWAIMPPMSGG
ncbi:hypothetical protein SLEP1_g17783 [Rubroshorea leprosula]|uniref:Molybdopterin synthase sulfur carrier subunit n=1 Tax=Rubroshorea leprosula TaxID=152421 RepID=A0AAV5J4D7_9ROSI|nr:hypothetical protein SLEP1_g17783 [Rubroshorea leprosula]